MPDIQQHILELQQKLYSYKQQQVQILKHLQQLDGELQRLQQMVQHGEQITQDAPIVEPVTHEINREQRPYIQQVHQRVAEKKQQVTSSNSANKLEDFIGSNLISKVGILITIIGIFIGAKYAIDKDLVSPAMRIILGYVAGVGLMAFSLKLKNKYRYFSSILMGGGLAVIYFITFIGFDFYQLFSKGFAFGFMFLTTAATVAIALWYNQKVIAILAQVGGYAIPFLLSDGTGNIAFLFAYIAIINVGLLVLSFKKNWKILYRLAFYISWLIYVVLLVLGEGDRVNFQTSLIFLTINFFTFYATFLAYKILRKEIFNGYEVAVLLLNALVFFFVGVYLVDHRFHENDALTLFTISNAAVHAAIGFAIYRMQLFDKSVVQFIISLALLFFTIAIPMELDGNWVTLLWTIEAALLFIIAIRNQRYLYVQIAMVVACVGILSLLQDWWQSYPYMQGTVDVALFAKQPFTNLNFWIQMFVASILAYIASRVANAAHVFQKGYAKEFFERALPVIVIALFYFNIYHEIHYAWDKLINSETAEIRIKLLSLYCSLSLIIYTVIFMSVTLVANRYYFKNVRFAYLFIALAFLVNVIFLLNGIYLLGELREFILQHYAANTNNIYVYRYALLLSVVAMWLAAYTSNREFPVAGNAHIPASVIFNITLLTIITNEFIHWMDIAGYANQYKLGLTIICGLYALGLLFVGISKRKKHFRISAIVLFAATIAKLFLYDLSSLSTISKTIVLVILGVLLLFASFLYNKFKTVLFVNDQPADEVNAPTS